MLTREKKPKLSVIGIHRWLNDSLHKGPVMHKDADLYIVMYCLPEEQMKVHGVTRDWRRRFVDAFTEHQFSVVLLRQLAGEPPRGTNWHMLFLLPEVDK